MSKQISNETIGAWLVHHGRKVAQDVNGASDFPVIDEAAKAADLLSRLAASDQTTLSLEMVNALARLARLNPRTELNHMLGLLESKRLIEQGNNGIDVIGITTRAALAHSATIFQESRPSTEELAAITLAEKTSERPVHREEMREYIGDIHNMTSQATGEFLVRAQQIGFIDGEGQGDDTLLFNGNLFRKDNINKTKLVLKSLSSQEEQKLTDFDTLLKQEGWLNATYRNTVSQT